MEKGGDLFSFNAILDTHTNFIKKYIKYQENLK